MSIRLNGKIIAGAGKGNTTSGGFEVGDIGITALGIDESQNKRRYLNGQLIIQDQFVSFTEKLKNQSKLYPSLICTQEEWQTISTMSVGGQVGKFVIDDEAGTIRLPKIIMPIQGLTDLSKLAEIVEAGLPNIEGKLLARRGVNSINILTGSGAFSGASDHTESWSDALSRTTGANLKATSHTFDASRSSKVYGNSDTVQQEQIQYPYFIQVATGAEESIDVSREIELNNPFSLLDYKYSEYELNNISWLKSEGQFNNGTVYVAVYELLLKLYNGTETKAGVTVKLNTEEFTDYDFVINQEDNTFRLPVDVKLASGKAVVGNGVSLGLTDGYRNYGIMERNNAYIGANSSAYNSTLGSTVSSGEYPGEGYKLGVTTDATKSGMELSNQGLYLYFYVGETVQNANLINIARIEETKTNVDASNFSDTGKSAITHMAMPSSRYTPLILGASDTTYTAPADGWFLWRVTGGGVSLYSLYNVTKDYAMGNVTNGVGYITQLFLPVNKNDIIRTTYQITPSNYALTFFYANGSESEAN